MRTGSALSDAVLKVFKHAIGNQKLRVLRPPVTSLGELYFFFPQRLSVRSSLDAVAEAYAR